MRAAAFFLSLAAMLAPAALAVAAALADSTSWNAWNEAQRLVTLIGNSLGLIAIAAMVAVPAGTLAAIVLERAAVPGARILRALVLLWLFVPLPVLAVAWQVVLGSWLPSLALAPGDVASRPWSLGLLPAGILHGLAGLPWVIVIVSAGLRTCDRTLEEDALVLGGPRLALRQVLIPRALLAAAAGLAWIAVQGATEIPVTDAMMVRTFAEEVYTQIVGQPAGVNAAILAALPGLLAAMFAAMLIANHLSRRLPHNPEPAAGSRPFRISRSTTMLSCGFVYLLFAVLIGLPLAALIWKCGGGGAATFSWTFAIEQFLQSVKLNARVLMQSLATAALTGLLTAWLATALAWSARGSALKNGSLIILAAVLALTPGPIVGLGLKKMIDLLLSCEESVLGALSLSLTFPPLRSLLYDQPSPLPAMLACLLRFLPLALLIVMPVVRSTPRDLLDAARCDGIAVWRHVGKPHLRRATGLAAVAVAGLTLGEVSAGKLVAPPGYRLFILDLFDQMHYGAEPVVAAMGLVQIAATGLLLIPAGYFLSRNGRD